MTARPRLPARPRRSAAGLLPEAADSLVERAKATAHPPRGARGRIFRLEVHGLRPQRDAGPVDLTIYAPRRAGPSGPSRYAGLDPERYEVLVEATLAVKGQGRRGGSARYTFRSARSDTPGVYVAVFRRTDVSSRPVAVRRFTVVR